MPSVSLQPFSTDLWETILVSVLLNTNDYFWGSCREKGGLKTFPVPLTALHKNNYRNTNFLSLLMDHVCLESVKTMTTCYIQDLKQTNM